MESKLFEAPPDALDTFQGISDQEADSVEAIAKRSNIEDSEIIARLLIPGQPFGPYKILSFIAAGGMGEVYAAERHMDDGRVLGPVALKIIAGTHSDDWRVSERFKREATISRAVRSPNVTRVYEYGIAKDQRPFLAMEFLEGKELYDLLYTDKVDFGVEGTVDLMFQLLKGLEAIHDAGFIHRDIKPENVYVDYRNGAVRSVKILDFGIAKEADQPPDPQLSQVGKVYGTPEYISPEQGLSPDVDHRSDLYSAGVIMYELLARQLPFHEPTPYATLLAHQKEPVPRLPGHVPLALQRVVERALGKTPEKRFQSAAEFADSIRAWRNEWDTRQMKAMEDLRQSAAASLPPTEAKGQPLLPLVITTLAVLAILAALAWSFLG